MVRTNDILRVTHITMFVLLVLLGLAPSVTSAAGQEGSFTVCHSTGSPTAPWVLITVDERTWPEHQAQGDFRANSLAECAQRPPPGSRVAGGIGPQPVDAGPDVALLPATGEPDRRTMVLALLALGGLGLCMRRLGHRGSRGRPA